VGVRYNVIRVYPLSSGTNSETIKIFGLRKISTEERLTLRIPSVNGLNTHRNAIKVV